jgi:adenylate cyclase
MTEQRRLAAILVADVVGYSKLVGEDEAGTLAKLSTLKRDVIEPAIGKHAGRLFKAVGDGFLVEFASAVQAVTAARAIQQANAGGGLPLRIGVHLGDVVVQGDDLLGDGVNIAARIEGVADNGGIAISRQVHDQVRDRLDFDFVDKGEIALKNLARPVHVFAVAGSKASVRAPALALPDKPSIAVLPFQNMSGDPEQEYFADGIVEDIITALSRFKSLFVIARNSSFTYKGKAVDIKQVGRELGVRYVLEGSVRKAGGRVRITGQLIEAATGAHLWAERFDSTLEDIFDLQDKVTTGIVSAVSTRLDQAEIARATRKPVGNLDAYDICLRAIARFREDTREACDDALRMLYRAIELDPDYSRAYGLAIRGYATRKVQGWNIDKASEITEVRRLASKVAAVGRDDELALASAGQALAWVCRDFQLGEALVEQALALNPNSAFVQQMHAYVSVYLGKHQAALDEIELVVRLNPLDPDISRSEVIRTAALVLLGRYEEAVACGTKLIARRPNWAVGVRATAIAHALGGNVAEAHRLGHQLRQLDPRMRLADLREFFPYGRPEDVEKLIEGLRIAGLPE